MRVELGGCTGTRAIVCGVVGGNHYFLTGGEIVENEKIEKILAPPNSGFPWTP